MTMTAAPTTPERSPADAWTIRSSARLDVSEAFKQMLYGVIVLLLAWLYVRLTGQKTGEGER
jgi:hypothetical protein